MTCLCPMPTPHMRRETVQVRAGGILCCVWCGKRWRDAADYADSVRKLDPATAQSFGFTTHPDGVIPTAPPCPITAGKHAWRSVIDEANRQRSIRCVRCGAVKRDISHATVDHP